MPSLPSKSHGPPPDSLLDLVQHPGSPEVIPGKLLDRKANGRGGILTLLGILLTALVLRVWGSEFGLPYVYHFDEHFYINTALNLGAGVLNNPPYAATGLSNILFGEYAAYFVVGRIFGIFTSPQALEAAYRSDPTVFYLLARLTAAVFGVAAVAAVYRLGRALCRQATRLLAAAFLAISFLHVRDAHYAVPDIVMPFFVLLAVVLAAAGLRSGKQRALYLAALAGGLAVSMKWTALPVILPVFWASIVVGRKPEDRLWRWLLNRTVLLTGLLLAVGFALGSPQIVYNPAPYLNEALGQMGAGQSGGFEIWQVDTLPGWLFYGKTLLWGVGVVLLALGVAGAVRRVVLAVRDRDAASVLLLSFPVSYNLVMGATRHYFARYALPLVPFLALFAAEIVVALVARLQARGWRRAYGLGVALAVLAMAQPLACSIQHNLLLTREDTRTLAKEWIEANLPEGSRIAVDWPVHGPPLSTEEIPMPDSETAYDVTLVGGFGLAEHPIKWYSEQGFDYLIASSFIYEIPLVDKGHQAERKAFYNSLDEELDLVQAFRPGREGREIPFIFDEIYGPAVSLWERERPGPTIKVYSVQR